MVNEKQCTDKTDEQLVGLTLKDQKYFQCLVERYEEKLMRYIRRISAVTLEDAEDILQDVFVKAYRNLNDFDQKLKFSSWIYRIAHNEVISRWRKTKSRPQVLKFEDNEDWIGLLASEEDLFEEIRKKFTASDTKNILKDMDVKYREVLVLKFLEGKDYKEISDILQKPLGTVATLINRAKKQFREIVEKKGAVLN